MPRTLIALGLIVTILAGTIATPSAAHAAATRLTPRESYILRMEATYFGYGGYNAYEGGRLTLHALHGPYVLTYPVWDGRLSATYRKTQIYILRLKYEMQLLAEETMDGGGAAPTPRTPTPRSARALAWSWWTAPTSLRAVRCNAGQGGGIDGKGA